MGIFYPDNPKRMNRVHQLVDDISNMQADIKYIGKEIDNKGEKLYTSIIILLRAHGMVSVDDLIKKAASMMTPDERKVFEALIQTCGDTNKDLSVWRFIAALLITPGGAVVSGKVAINIARWGSRILSVQGLAGFVTAADAGEVAAAAAAAEIAAEAEAAAGALEGIGEAAEAAEVAAEIAEATSVVASVSVFLGILAGIGLVVGLIAGVLDLFEGAAQYVASQPNTSLHGETVTLTGSRVAAHGRGRKEKLVKAIHGLQPARLTTAIFKLEGEHIVEQLRLLEIYLDFSPAGENPDPQVAKYLGDRIVDNIRLENKKIDPDEIETDLEAQDRLSGQFYGGADLSHDAVIAATSKR